MKHKERNLTKDIGFTSPPENLIWDEENALSSAEKLVCYVRDEATTAITWYLHKKTNKRIWAMFLRAFAIIMSCFGALVPVIAQTYPETIEPAFASIFLIIAVTAIALDRFFGFSTSWMRFLRSELRIRKALNDFLFQWELDRADFTNDKFNNDHIKDVISKCNNFSSSIDEILQDELEQWIKEFQKAIDEVEKSIKKSNKSQQ